MDIVQNLLAAGPGLGETLHVIDELPRHGRERSQAEGRRAVFRARRGKNRRLHRKAPIRLRLVLERRAEKWKPVFGGNAAFPSNPEDAAMPLNDCAFSPGRAPDAWRLRNIAAE
jgi:hypothetical protein